jgi:glycosyltransferase involved in cell wall biosynthesis
MAGILQRRFNFPFLYDMQSSMPEHLATRLFFRIRPIQKICGILEKWLLSTADSVVCSAGLSAHVCSVAPGVQPQEWIFPAGNNSITKTETAELRKELQVPDNTKIILYSGSFARYQGLPILINAIPKVAAEMSDVLFIIIGATQQIEIEMVTKLIKGEFEKNMRILPRVSKDRIPHFLELADILVSTRIQSANLPLKVFEYLASGKPIVATDIPAHRAVLNNDIAVLVEPSANEIAQAIISLLKDPDRAVQLSDASKRYANNNLSWDKFVDSVDKIYQQFRD